MLIDLHIQRRGTRCIDHLRLWLRDEATGERVSMAAGQVGPRRSSNFLVSSHSKFAYTNGQLASHDLARAGNSIERRPLFCRILPVHWVPAASLGQEAGRGIGKGGSGSWVSDLVSSGGSAFGGAAVGAASAADDAASSSNRRRSSALSQMG